MAGSLIKITSASTTSNVSTIDIGGANWDSSYDVYMVKIYNLQQSTGTDVRLKARILKSDNSADTTANYDYAIKGLRTGAGFDNLPDTNQTEWSNLTYLFRGNTSYGANAILYLFNFNNASEYNFITVEGNGYGYDGSELMGGMGGGVHTVAQVAKGLQFSLTTNSISNADIDLYGLKK
tara:strand:- start:479 stop:1015 length:537 start_codon:yes stop_codon:yes gene_type:complete